MIRSYRDIIGTPVVHFDQGDTLAFVRGVIIHPDNGRVEAFWLKSVSVPLESAIVQAQDVVEWKKNLYVKSESVIADPTEVIRIEDILSQKRTVLGNRVRGESGEYYGKVDDFDFVDDTYYLKRIHVQKNVLGLFPYDSRIFSYEDIIEVLPDMILVKDDATKKEATTVTSFIEGKGVDLA